jgi:Ni/Fe-hydrogenase 1 B-type cytochrome subunit
MNTSTIGRVYVWQLPVRLYHWVNALCVLALAVTGYLIGSPLAIKSGAEAYLGYWFGTVRFIHFVAAFVFFFNFLFRIYWGFVGNTFAKWQNFILHRKEQLEEAKDVLRIDIFQASGKPLESIGHNSLAGFTYFISFLVFLFQSMTGFGMYAAMSLAAAHVQLDCSDDGRRFCRTAVAPRDDVVLPGLHDGSRLPRVLS